MQLFFFREIERDFNKHARKLIGKSAKMQVGFFTGYFVAASSYYVTINNMKLIEIIYNSLRDTLVFILYGLFSIFFQSIITILHYLNFFNDGDINYINYVLNYFVLLIRTIPIYNDIGAFGSMSLLFGLFGLILFIVYRLFIPESNYWMAWKFIYNQHKYLTDKIENKTKKGKLVTKNANNENVKKQIYEKKISEPKPGIKKLIDNKKYRGRVVGFWLILSGLMYMYYSTVVVIPEILSRDNIVSIPLINFGEHLLHQIDISQKNAIILFFEDNIKNKQHFVTLIILFTALFAHFALGVILWNAWRNGSGHREKAIYRFYNALKFSKILDYITKRIFGVCILGDKDNIDSKENKEKVNEHNLDIISIKGIGYLIIIIGIINAIIFYIWVKDDAIHRTWLLISTAFATLIANLGWALVPSMLASRFPTHLRITGASLAYNGGLTISFASPFIIMEFYLSIKSEYIIFIAMILGAISMIIGSRRLMAHERDS
jgi:hypothetical protein